LKICQKLYQTCHCFININEIEFNFFFSNSSFNLLNCLSISYKHNKKRKSSNVYPHTTVYKTIEESSGFLHFCYCCLSFVQCFFLSSEIDLILWIICKKILLNRVGITINKNIEWNETEWQIISIILSAVFFFFYIYYFAVSLVIAITIECLEWKYFFINYKQIIYRLQIKLKAHACYTWQIGVSKTILFSF
jgi:hypothetical protein